MGKFGLALAVALVCAGPVGVAPAWGQGQARPRTAASDPMTEANLSRDSLKAAYDAAKMAVSIDEDGDIKIKDRVTLFVFPNKERIRLIVYYAFKPEVSLQQKLALANRINQGFIVARASVGGQEEGQLQVDYYLLLGTGMSRATIVAATKRFITVAADAVKESDKEDIVK